MARRHVVEYFLEQQSLYVDLLNNVKDLDEEFKKGTITEQQLVDAKNDILRAKENYERIGYIMFLLNKPNRKDKHENRNTQIFYDALKCASKEALLDESKDALSDLKKILKATKTQEAKVNHVLSLEEAEDVVNGVMNNGTK